MITFESSFVRLKFIFSYEAKYIEICLILMVLQNPNIKFYEKKGKRLKKQ
eukprot:TRINITY_DN11026_c0_g1_i1.p2 TRINITY_DN11026_c0_g1~~TRINITY_DN11026_c0_g1_i1.p2  ORF type:complete len:50 (-),score=12.55 TRINITY_DN11026_c0_g1_i1:42-191(-)